MASTLSSNMNLIIPGVGSEAGPTYAFDVNTSLTIIDQHTHTPGSGVAITPAAININAPLPFSNNFATSVAGITLFAQSVQPAINTIYESGDDLYFSDGLGNAVRITQSGGVAGSPGSISNLTSPASAAYVAGSSTFVWQSGSSIAANMDFGAAIMRNLSPNSTYALTLQPPAALAANYSVTLPSLPAATAFLTMDTAGVMSASPALLGALTTANLAAAAGITGAQIAALTLTAANIANGTITGTQISSSAALSIASLATSGAVVATGAVSGASLTASGAVSGATVAASGTIQQASRNVLVNAVNSSATFAFMAGSYNAHNGGGGGPFALTTGVGATVGFPSANNVARFTFTNAFSVAPVVMATAIETSAKINSIVVTTTYVEVGCDGGVSDFGGATIMVMGQR